MSQDPASISKERAAADERTEFRACNQGWLVAGEHADRRLGMPAERGLVSVGNTSNERLKI